MDDTADSTITRPQAGGLVFVFKETEHPEGGRPRTIAFTNVDIKPLSYHELAAAKLHRPVTIPLEMYNGRIVGGDVEGVDASKYAHITAKLESPFTARAIGLVRGGWLPSALAATREMAVVLPDRNVISEIAGRFNNGIKVGGEADFLDLFAGTPIRINPLLWALEGNGRAIPDAAAVRAQLEEGMAKVRAALPMATIMAGPQSIDGLLGLIEETRSSITRKQALLRQLAPLLAAPVARRRVDAHWSELLTLADELGVARNSLVILALLSTLVNPRHCAAKRLLKFHASYSDADAYNALSDLRSLEILLYCLAFFPEYDFQLCTADRHLALFWVGLGASEIAHDGVRVQFNLTPHRALLPPSYAERWLTDTEGRAGMTGDPSSVDAAPE